MKNFLKKHFYSISEIYNKTGYDYWFLDVLRLVTVSLILIINFIVFMRFIIWFIAWDFSDYAKLIRGTLVLIFFYFIILKKWWKSKD